MSKNLSNRIEKKIKKMKEKLTKFTPPRSEVIPSKPFKNKKKYTRKTKYNDNHR